MLKKHVTTLYYSQNIPVWTSYDDIQYLYSFCFHYFSPFFIDYVQRYDCGIRMDITISNIITSFLSLVHLLSLISPQKLTAQQNASSFLFSQKKFPWLKMDWRMTTLLLLLWPNFTVISFSIWFELLCYLWWLSTQLLQKKHYHRHHHFGKQASHSLWMVHEPKGRVYNLQSKIWNFEWPMWLWSQYSQT